MIYLMPKEHEAIAKVVDYLYHDEQKHYEEALFNKIDTKDHIFRSVRKLKRLRDIWGEKKNGTR